jgi:hypothetical protein
LFLLAGTVACVVLYVFDPATTSWFPACPFRALTGWSCPGCGTLRALHALLHLDIQSALRANAITTAVVLLLPPAAVGRALGFAPDATVELTAPRALARALVVLFAFGVVRNVPVWPFTWLSR